MKRFAVLASAALLLAACQTEKVETSVIGEVQIVPVITKATDVNFESGDAIGVSIVRAEAQYSVNDKLTYSNDVFSGTLMWYPEAMDKCTVSAYYPYQASGVPTSFTVASDQTSGLSASDLIAGVKADVTPSANAVVVPFKHQLTKIVLNVDNQSGAAISSVVLGNSKVTADVDVPALKASASESSETADIKAFAVETGVKYASIVVPQTVAFRLSVTTSTGAVLSQNLASAELKQGGQYSVNVTVLPADLKVSISGEIENWTDEGEIGAGEPDFIEFEEGIGYFIYKNERYSTVTLSNGSVWMSQPMRYVPEGYTVSTDPAEGHIWAPYTLVANEDGKTYTPVPSTDRNFIETNGYLYDMNVILGADVTAENAATFEGAQGICPAGWHVPTWDDYFAICGASNKRLTDSTAPSNPDAVFYDETYKAGRITLMNAGGWNVVLPGLRQMNSETATPVFGTTYADATKCSIEAYYGHNAMSYFPTSTLYNIKNNTDGSLNSIQFFAAMTTFTSANIDGKFSLSYMNYRMGSQLRCVKDAASE